MWRYANTSELYHTGVLGMKWGHHKNKIATNNKNSKKLSTGKKIAIGVGVGATIVAGTYFARRYYHMNADVLIKKRTRISTYGTYWRRSIETILC